MTTIYGEEGQRLFLYYFNNKPQDIVSLFLEPGRSLSQVMEVKNGNQIYARNITSLYGKNFKLVNLRYVSYHINTAPFFDYSNVETMDIYYSRLKFFDISKFRNINSLTIMEYERSKKPNFSALKKMYPHAEQYENTLYIRNGPTSSSPGPSPASPGPSPASPGPSRNYSSAPKKVCPEGKRLTKTGNRCIKGKNYKAVVVQKSNGQRQTVCYEGYKMTKNGKCIKDKQYKTIVVPVETPVTGDLIKFQEVVKAPSIKKSVPVGDLISFVPSIKKSVKAPSVKKPVSGSISYRNYMADRVDEF